MHMRSSFQNVLWTLIVFQQNIQFVYLDSLPQILRDPEKRAHYDKVTVIVWLFLLFLNVLLVQVPYFKYILFDSSEIISQARIAIVPVLVHVAYNASCWMQPVKKNHIAMCACVLEHSHSWGNTRSINRAQMSTECILVCLNMIGRSILDWRYLFESFFFIIFLHVLYTRGHCLDYIPAFCYIYCL